MEKVIKKIKIVFKGVFFVGVVSVFGVIYCFCEESITASTAAVNEVFELVRSSSSVDRLEAIKRLFVMEDTTSCKALMEIYESETDNYLKVFIVENIRYKNCEESYELILKGLEDVNKEVRKAAWLGVDNNGLKDKEKRKKIIDNFKKEKDRDVKKNALWKLAIDKTTDTVNYMLSIINDKTEDDEIKKEALRHIYKMNTNYSKRKISELEKKGNKIISDEIKRLKREKK